MNEIGIVNTIRSEIERLTGVGDIKFTANLPDDEIPLGDKTKIAFHSVFNHVISSIDEHSNPTSIYVSIEKQFNRLILKIEDNGLGMPEELLHTKISGGNYSIQETISSIGGYISINSKEKVGTFIKIICFISD